MATQKSLPQLRTKLPAPVQELIDFIEKRGFILYLVGGPLRDYLLKEEISFDLDFEIQSQALVDQDQWLERLYELQNEITSKLGYKTEKLPFGIFKIDLGEFQCEFASARLEKYKQGKKSYHHSDFESELISHLEPKKALARRDLTVNAMAYELSSATVFDPFQGANDLEEKILRPVHPDFEKDPVRLLRAFRFRELLQAQFSPELEKMMAKMSLEQLSDFSIQKEIHKTQNSLKLFFSLKKFIEKHRLPVSKAFKDILALPLFQKKQLKLESTGSFLLDCLFLAQSQILPKHQDLLCDFFRWKKKDLKSYLTLIDDLEAFEQSSDLHFKKPLKELLDDPLIQTCKRLVEQVKKEDPVVLKAFALYPKTWQFFSNLKGIQSFEDEAIKIRDEYPPKVRSFLATALLIKGAHE